VSQPDAASADVARRGGDSQDARNPNGVSAAIAELMDGSLLGPGNSRAGMEALAQPGRGSPSEGSARWICAAYPPCSLPGDARRGRRHLRGVDGPCGGAGDDHTQRVVTHLAADRAAGGLRLQTLCIVARQCRHGSAALVARRPGLDSAWLCRPANKTWSSAKTSCRPRGLVYTASTNGLRTGAVTRWPACTM